MWIIRSSSIDVSETCDMYLCRFFSWTLSIFSEGGSWSLPDVPDRPRFAFDKYFSNGLPFSQWLIGERPLRSYTGEHLSWNSKLWRWRAKKQKNIAILDSELFMPIFKKKCRLNRKTLSLSNLYLTRTRSKSRNVNIPGYM